MQTGLWKKALVFCIIMILFFGSCFVSALKVENNFSNLNNDNFQNLIKNSENKKDLSDDDWIELDKLLASDGEEYDTFGRSVSIDGDYVIIGAIRDNDNGLNSGSAYIFYRSGSSWTEQQKIIAADGEDYDYFGNSVSIDGDYAIIGVDHDNDNGDESGSAYIFKREGTVWNEPAKLLASDGELHDWFGYSVSISGDFAAIGAIGDDDNGQYSGAAYIFKYEDNVWTEQTKLVASDGEEDDEFGTSVSIDGDYTIIGAPFNNDNGQYSGSAYVFKREDNAWTEQTKLIASDGEEDNEFGCSVSIDGDYSIIGSQGDNDSGLWSGSAYIFKREGTTWTGQTKLVASDGEEYDEFGHSVSISKNCIIIGSEDDDDKGEGSGSAYIFTKDDEPPIIKIIKPERGFYFFNKKILPRIFRLTKIVGPITFEAIAYDDISGIEKVEFYINGQYMANDTSYPYTFESRWIRPRLFHWFIIKAVAYDNAGNTDVERLIVRKLL
jgi:hypothetical protein